MAGYSAQVGGGEVEFENSVPLCKGSARVAKWGGNLEMGIARAGQQNDGGGEKTL